MTAPITRPRSLLLVVAMVVLGALGTPAASLAQCQGQSGTSALEQYCEAVPSGDGGRDQPNSDAGSGSGPSVTKATAGSLKAAGQDGAAVAALAAGGSGGSGNAGGASGGPGDTPKSGAANVEGPADPSSNPLNAATEAASSGPVAGKAITWALIALTALGAIGAVLLRRRSGGQPTSGNDPAASA